MRTIRATRKRPMTAREFAKRYVDVPFCELERGEVIHLSAGGLAHSRCTGNAYFLLEQWSRQTGLGRAFTGETGLITEHDPDTVRGADVAYFSYQRLPTERRPPGFSTVPADLVVEVVGKGQGWDRLVEKAREYLRMGVDRVWILDPQRRTMHVVQGEAEPMPVQDEVRDEAILPGFRCHVAEFFRD